VAELGSIYEGDTREGVRGRDLRVEVRYPAYALGDAEGIWVDVPLSLPVEGELVARTPSAFDREGKVLLRLPENFPRGGALRLRGQGESPSGGGPAGDLFVQVQIDEEAKRTTALRGVFGAGLPALPAGPSTPVIIAVALGGAATLYWIATTI